MSILRTERTIDLGRGIPSDAFGGMMRTVSGSEENPLAMTLSPQSGGEGTRSGFTIIAASCHWLGMDGSTADEFNELLEPPWLAKGFGTKSIGLFVIDEFVRLRIELHLTSEM